MLPANAVLLNTTTAYEPTMCTLYCVYLHLQCTAGQQVQLSTAEGGVAAELFSLAAALL
jgi:hypothetical protein